MAAAGEPVQWIFGPDGLTLAWLSGVNHITVQSAAFPGETAPGKMAWPEPKTLVTRSDLVTFDVLQDGTIGLVLVSGELVQQGPSKAEAGARLSLGARVSWAQMRGDCAAVVMVDKIRIYKLVRGDWKMIEERPDFLAGSDRRLPADGQILAVAQGGIRMGEQTLNTPGKVANVAMTDQRFLIVSGVSVVFTRFRRA